MSTISVTNIADGDAVTAASINNQINTIVNDYNGGITAANLAANAVTDVKITANNLLATKFSNPYKFSVYRTAALTSVNTFTALAFDTKLFDTGTNVDIVTNKGRFTAPVTGFYFFSSTAGNTAAANTFMGIALYVNGVQKLVGTTADPSQATSSGTKMHVNGLLSLTAADYVETYFIGGNGSTVEVGAAGCWFTGFLVSSI